MGFIWLSCWGCRGHRCRTRQHLGLAPVAPAVVGQNHDDRSGRADGEAPPQGVHTQHGLQKPGRWHANAPHGDAQNEHGGQHRTRGTHHARQHKGHAKEQEGANRNVVEVARHLQRCAAGGQKPAQHIAIQQHDEGDEPARQQNVGQHACAGRGIHALPQARTHVLRGHG